MCVGLFGFIRKACVLMEPEGAIEVALRGYGQRINGFLIRPWLPLGLQVRSELTLESYRSHGVER